MKLPSLIKSNDASIIFTSYWNCVESKLPVRFKLPVPLPEISKNFGMNLWMNVNDKFEKLEFKEIDGCLLFLFIIGIIISLLSGTNATGPVLYTIDGLGWSISGVILGFLYFSPIKKEFEK